MMRSWLRLSRLSLREAGLPRLALTCWALASLALAWLPPGVGGLPRTINAIVFMTLGPAVALAWYLARMVPLAVAGVVGLAASLVVLLLISQLLLLTGLWTPWRVAALIALVMIVLTWVPDAPPTEVKS
jgi:hypothetical protein